MTVPPSDGVLIVWSVRVSLLFLCCCLSKRFKMHHLVSVDVCVAVGEV